ncbi:MAG: molecular chaperone DnaJ [Actinobacteria bacterium]|nr:molecular chaperone DnaJ [Actinomycetota bacterium]
MAAKDLYEKDYYAILGVDNKADGVAIKKKYRQLARELHPDKTKGDKKLEDRFKEVSEAYDILSDDKKRAEYDQAREMFKSGAYRQGANQYGGDFSDLFSGGDIFSSIFGSRRGPRKGADTQSEVSISFRDSIFGKEIDIKPNLTVRIPAGISDGGKIRVKGRGQPGEAGPGDLYLLVSVVPHPVFSRKGENIHLKLPVTFTEAALGADIPVATLEGDLVTLRLSPGTTNGKTFRIRGRGVKKGVNAGDLMVTIDVQVPQRIDGKAKKALEDFAAATKTEDPRGDFMQHSKA